MQSPPWFELLGVPLQLWTEPELTQWTCEAAQGTRLKVVAHVNLHSLRLAQEAGVLRECLRTASAVHIDGMAAVALCRVMGIPARREHRVTYVDWLNRLLSGCVEHDLGVFFVGGRPGVGETVARLLRVRHSDLRFDSHHGYFDNAPESEENRRVLDRICAFGTNVLLVGMGMPRQERWIVENRDRLSAGACLPCGAAMDYVAGLVPTPPRWSGRLGIEWLFRLNAEPTRLAYRYLIEPWGLAGPIAKAWWRQRFGRRET